MIPSDERAFFPFSPNAKRQRRTNIKMGSQKERHRAKITRGIPLHGCGFIVAWNQRRKTNGGAPRRKKLSDDDVILLCFAKLLSGLQMGEQKALRTREIVLKTEKCVFSSSSLLSFLILQCCVQTSWRGVLLYEAVKVLASSPFSQFVTNIGENLSAKLVSL